MSTILTKEVKTRSHRIHVNIERYESAMEVVRDCRNRKITSSSFCDQSKASFGHWEGVESYEEALTLLQDGYQPTVDGMKDSIKATVAGSGKRIKFDNNVYGFAPVVPLALKGVPNCMVNMTMKPIKEKVIDVYYDMTTNSGTDSDTIIKNGQKLLGAIVALEKQGYKFNLYACQTYSDDYSVDMLIVKVKPSDKPIDLKRISFPLTHTAFFRVIGFDWYSKFPNGKYRSGYGRALRYNLDTDELREYANQVFGKNALFISGREIQNTGEEHLREVLTNDKSKN